MVLFLLHLVVFFQLFAFRLGCKLLVTNSIKSTADSQIAVLEEKNELVLKQIEPLVNKYLAYEGEVYKNLKLDANMIISTACYPQLKADEFVRSQITIFLHNQEEITGLKLKKARLDAYKFWIYKGAD